MFGRILSFMAVLVLVVGCAKKPDDTGSITTDSDSLVGTEGQANAGVDQGALGAAQAGTQQDLVVNIGDRIFFGYDQFDLTSEARGVIERQSEWMKTYANVNVVVEGHCDERGTREYNLALGEKRATAVRNYLIANGVAPSRVQTISYGKERPAVMGSDDSSWAQNRRGVLVVQ
jgi:peptidoglycan-associated lipoprotein